MEIKNQSWLILTQYYPPEIGAPQIRLRALVRELKARGVLVSILTAMPNYPAGKVFPGYEGKWLVREYIDDVLVRRTWVYPGTGKSPLIRLLNYFSFTFTAFFAALFGPKPDVLFVESQPFSLGFVAVLMKWIRGVPYIYNVPDLQVDVARQVGFIRNEYLLRLAQKMEDFFLKESWKVSTVTHRFIEHFVNRGIPREQITFLPNGADTSFLRPRLPDKEILQRWNLEQKTIFAYVGTHAYYHGLDTLISAATMLNHQGNIAFLLIGEGPERSRLKELAAERGLTNVIFGESPYEEMARLYSVVYASIATLRRIDVAKGMRLSKIYPSLSCGVPVIYSGFGEAAEIIQSNHCGITVPPEDPEKLAEAIVNLAGKPAIRGEMGKAGRLLVEHEYSWQSIVDRWLTDGLYAT